MTSNLPVVGTAVQAEPSQVSRESFGVGLGGAVSTVGAESDFASVLAEVMGGVRSASPATATSARTSELVSPSLQDAARARAQLERALFAEDAARWLAAPIVYRAIDAYRELMNVSA